MRVSNASTVPVGRTLARLAVLAMVFGMGAGGSVSGGFIGDGSVGSSVDMGTKEERIIWVYVVLVG